MKINFQKIALLVLVQLLFFGVFSVRTPKVSAIICSDCTYNQCGGICEDWERCVQGNGCNYCQTSSACGVGTPTPTPERVDTPTPPPGTTPPPPQATPTPTDGPTPTPDACAVDCSGQVCADDTSSSCTTDADCVSGYTCNTATNRCQKCTTPGTACCGYCVPAGWGCNGSTCPFKKNCKGWDQYGNLNCDLETSCSGSNPCSGSYTSTCYDCFEACEPTPTPTPIPLCNITSLTVSAPDMCLAEGQNITYTLNWTATNANLADYIRTFWIDADNGNSWVESGFSPASPLSNTATSNQITLPPRSDGYGFWVCCSGGNQSGTYGCAYAGSSNNWIYMDVGAPNAPTFDSTSPSYDPASNQVTFKWLWTGDDANCATGVCSNYEGPVNYCINGQPVGSYSPLCGGCYSPYYWQVVVDGTGDTLQKNNNAQSSVTQSCEGYGGQKLRVDVRSKDARGMGLWRMSRAAGSRVHPASFRSPELQLRVA